MTTRHPRWRRLAYAALAAVAAALMVFPQSYVARARIVPQGAFTSGDVGVGGPAGMLGPAVGSAQNVGAMLAGGRPDGELYLVLARSRAVRAGVVDALGLAGPGRRFGTTAEAIDWLDRAVDVQLLPGGVLQVETALGDPGTARGVTAAYLDATARRLRDYGARLARNRTAVLEAQAARAAERVRMAAAGDGLATERSRQDLQFAMRVDESYRRLAQQVAAQALATESGAVVQVVDPVTVTSERPHDVAAAAALALVLLLALFTEWYAPATGLFPPARVPLRTEELA